jgi:hypothetical protein
MEYICDKIIHVTEFEILNIYFKIRGVDGILGWIFYGVWYWYKLIKFKKIYFKKNLGLNSILKICFFAIF